MLRLNRDKHVYMFAGKGGVGKTTCAAATALHFASLGENTLIISTDPTPSLADIFELKDAERGRPIKVIENLFVEEIGLDEVKERWKAKFGPEVYEVVSAYIPIEPDYIDYFAQAPGIGDEFMLDHIRELVESRKYDKVVWDTAPGGHTLRLLKLPGQFIEHMNAAVRIYSKLKRTRETKRSVLDTINGWKSLSQKVLSFLQNQTEFILVTIPEALSLRQVERILQELAGHGFTVNQLVINSVLPKADPSFFARE